MILRSKKNYLWYLVFGICVLITVPSRVSAVEQPAAGLTVAPAQLSFRVKTEAPSQTEVIKITNTYNTKLELTAELQAIDETGVRLVPAGPVDQALASAITLSSSNITVPVNGTYELRVRVDDSTKLADGGHYASLVLTQRASSSSVSTFRPSVAVSLFITKDQNIRTDFQLTNLAVNRTLFLLPSSATLTFKNLGNMHVTPRASVSVYDDETLIGKAVVNVNSQVLFPGEQADFKAPIETYGRIFTPRKLQIRTMYRIDNSDIQLIAEQTFWYIPSIDVIAVVVVGAFIWWRHRQIRRFVAKIVKAVRFKPHRSSSKKSSNSATASRTTTKRILGRTVIRTHQALSRSIARPPVVPRLQAAQEASTADRQPTQKHIVVALAEEVASNTVKSDAKPPKAEKIIPVKTSKPKTTPKKSEKSAVKSATKTATTKMSKKTPTAKPKKAGSKTPKSTTKNKPKKTT